MNKLLNPAYWARALSHPLVLLGLLVDLLPICGVIAWGWNAVPLVMLYWMENVVAGVMTIPRLVISGASYGGVGFMAGAGLSVFFVFHYGLFCFVHGTFLMVFAGIGDPESMAGIGIGDPLSIVNFALSSGLHVDWIVYIIAAFQVAVFFWEFISKGEWKNTNPMAEMFAPYARIVVLHFGIFAGAAALFVLGQPMVGVLALIVFRALWGIVTNSRRFGMEAGLDAAVDNIGGREKFEKLLKGQDPEAP